MDIFVIYSAFSDMLCIATEWFFRYRYRTLIATEWYLYLCYRMLQNGAATERIRCPASLNNIFDS
jgi:hypothetical protein